MLSDPTILLLDEATSAMDENTEKMVLNLLRNQFREATIFSIGHRKGISEGEFWNQILLVEEKKVKDVPLDQ